MDGEAMAFTQKAFPSLPRQARMHYYYSACSAGAMVGRNLASNSGVKFSGGLSLLHTT